MEKFEDRNQDLQIRKFLSQKGQQITFRNNQINWSQMESLSISSLTQEQSKLIANNFISLKKFQLYTSFSHHFLNDLSQITTLMHLSFSFQQNMLLEVFPKFVCLKKLSITNLESNNYFQQAISNNPSLESIGLITYLNNQLIESLKSLKHLKQLSFEIKNNRNQAVYGNIILIVKSMPSLTFLQFYQCGITDQTLKGIVESNPHIQGLRLYYNQVTQQGIQCLKSLKFIESLSIRNYPQNNTNIASLLKATPNLKKLSFSKNNLTTGQFLEISSNLKSLEMLGIFSRGYSNVNQFNESLKNITSLRELHLQFQYNNKTVFAIHNGLPLLNSLSLLELKNKGLSDSGCYYLNKLKSLKDYTLFINMVSSVGMNKLLRNSKMGCFNYNLKKQISSKGKRNAKMFQLARHLLVRCNYSVTY